MYMKHYTEKDGLLCNSTYMCEQDMDGYIWIANTCGLNRFDGKEFKSFGSNDGEIIEDIVINITNDGNNRIWAKPLYQSTSFSVIENNKVTIYEDSSILSLFAQGQYLNEHVYARKSQTAYLIGKRSLMCINKQGKPRFKKTSIDNPISIFETENGHVFFCDGVDIYSVKDTNILFSQHLKSKERYTSLSYYNNILYLSNNYTIATYSYESNKFKFLNKYTLEKAIHKIHADIHGLWVSIYNSKNIKLYRKHDLKQPYQNIKLPGLIDRLFTDNQGGLWINIVDNGVIHIPNPSLVTYTIDDGLLSDMVMKVEFTKNNKMWLGYHSGDVELIDITNNKIKKWRSFQLKDEYPGYNFIIDIKEYNNKTYFTSRGKIALLKNNQLITLPKIGSTYKSLFVIDDTTLSIGSTSLFLYSTKSKKKKKYSIGRIFAQSFGDDKSLWLGGQNGLFKIQKINADSPRSIPFFDGIVIKCLYYYHPYMWVGTISRGLFLLKGDSIISSFNPSNSILGNYISSVEIDSNNIWVGTDKGVLYSQFDYKRLKFTNEKLLNNNDGLLSNEITVVKKYKDKIIIGTNNGGISFLNQQKQEKNITYTVSDITCKNLATNNTATGDSIEYTYSREGLEIEFHTVALKYHDEIYYRYKLEPFHSEWRTTKNNVIQYTNIPPGKYKFLIDVQDNRPNTTTTLNTTHIYIKPLFWQTVWFKIIISLLLLSLIGLLFYWYYLYNKKKTYKQLERNRIIAKTKLETLKAQIKPHFIFNSLNAIQDYIYTNSKDDVVKLLQNFATLIRNGLHFSDNDFITVEEEIAFLGKYLSLEKVKCEDCFDYKIEAPDELLQFNIPSLITQPFVENAVVHGLNKNKHSLLSIVYSLEGENIICAIKDNGVGIKESLRRKKKNSSKGMGISMERINYFKTGLNIDIDIRVEDLSEHSDDNTGTSIIITIFNITKKLNNENNSINN